MIYVFSRCVDYEGETTLTAASNIKTLIKSINRLVCEDVSLGEYIEIEFFNDEGISIGITRLTHSDIPGKKIDFRSKNASGYLVDTPDNWLTLAKRILDEEAKFIHEYASNKSDV